MNLIEHKMATPKADPAIRSVSVLFSDIVGFTALTERLGDRRAFRVVERHHRIVRRQLAMYDGEEVELRGDCFFLVFGSASDAIDCAIGVQRELELDSFEYPDERIRVRLGLHSGAAIRTSQGYFGRDIIVAARIASLAGPREILVSRDTVDALGSRSRLCFGPGRRVALQGLAGAYQIHPLIWRLLPAEQHAARIRVSL